MDAAGREFEGSLRVAFILANKYPEYVPKQRDKMYWGTLLAESGDAKAMLWLAKQLEKNSDSIQARNWIRSAVYAGVETAQFDWIIKTVFQNPDVISEEEYETTKNLAHSYSKELLDKNADAAIARAVVEVAKNNPTPDWEKAISMLQPHVDGNEEFAMYVQSVILNDKRNPSRNKKAAESLLQAAAKHDPAYGLVELAIFQASDNRFDEASENLEKAIELGSELANNNLAWLRCTWNDEKNRDGSAGLKLSSKLIESQPDVLIYSNTHAACLAASGQFEEAVRLQKKIIAQVSLHQPPSKHLVDLYDKHLKAFESKLVFIDTYEE